MSEQFFVHLHQDALVAHQLATQFLYLSTILLQFFINQLLNYCTTPTNCSICSSISYPTFVPVHQMLWLFINYLPTVPVHQNALVFHQLAPNFCITPTDCSICSSISYPISVPVHQTVLVVRQQATQFLYLFTRLLQFFTNLLPNFCTSPPD